MVVKIRRSFTARDYDTYKERILNHLLVKFPTAYNDLRVSNSLNVILEAVLKLSDDLTFYLEHVHNETFIDTVGERKNITSLAKLLGYKLRNLTASSVILAADTDPYTPSTLNITKGTVINTSVQGIQFVIAKDYTFTGDTVFTLEAVEGFPREDIFTSTGQSSQVYTSLFDKVVENVVPEVLVNSVLWTSVDTLFLKDAGNFYEITNTDDLKIQVTFGDGVHGNIPPAGAQIKIRYHTGQGELGNIPAGAINTVFNANLTTPSGTRTVRVNNSSTNASGGESAETVEEARINAPLSIREARGLVSASDYKSFALATPGVLASTISIDNFLNVVTLYIVATGYQAPGTTLLNNLKAAIQAEQILGLIIDVKAPVFVKVDLSGVVTVQDSFNLAEVQTKTLAAVKEFFEPVDPISSGKDFGQPVFFSDVVKLIANQAGVLHVNLIRLSREPTFALINWHSTTATITNLVLGTTAKEEVWSVVFTSSTQFQLIGSVSGLQQNVGTINVSYATDGGELSFTISQGVDPLEKGDLAKIRTSAYLGDLQIDANEFALQGNVNLTFKYRSL